LFLFELRGMGIDFVLNEATAVDVYPEVDEELKPFVHACCEKLLRSGTSARATPSWMAIF